MSFTYLLAFKKSLSLTNQIKKSSRSVSTNISEAFRKRQSSKHFVSKLGIK